MNRWSIGLALMLSGSALGSKLQDKVQNAAADVERIQARADVIERQVVPGRGFITERQADERFQDYVYFYMIGEYEMSAEGFYALVTTGALADAGLNRDAEWYLADALYQMGNLVTAEARFQVIAEDDAHPFRDDAVRRLLELHASAGHTEAFYRYYNKEIVKGKVRPSDLITYTVGKSFYKQGESVKAKSHLMEIAIGSPFYMKSRYVLGTIMVVDGELDDALVYFRETADLSVDTMEDRKIHDLSLLAMGRIYYEQGKYEQASEAYGRIAGDSEYLDDKLYEMVWTFIKQEAYEEALKGVEIFLLAFPEHQYTAQLEVLQGHLHMAKTEYDAALSSYEQVIANYTPIRERFSVLAAQETVDPGTFQQVLALERGENLRGRASGGLPVFALAMMAADKDLSKALGVYRELERQETNVDASEQIIAELSDVLANATGLGGFEQLDYDASLNRGLATQARLTVLAVEADWLGNQASGDLRREIEATSKERAALSDQAKKAAQDWERARVSGEVQAAELHIIDDVVDAATGKATTLQAHLLDLHEELRLGNPSVERTEQIKVEIADSESDLRETRSALEGAQAKADVQRERLRMVTNRSDLETDFVASMARLRKQYRGYRQQLGVDTAVEGRRFDQMDADLVQVIARMDVASGRLSTIEEAELRRVKSRFEHEIQEVASQRVELERSLVAAEAVSIDLTRSGFGRLEDFFADSVLRADMGIVDVYWAQKLEIADQKDRVKKEKNDLLRDLQQRFGLIRQKLH